MNLQKQRLFYKSTLYFLVSSVCVFQLALGTQTSEHIPCVILTGTLGHSLNIASADLLLPIQSILEHILDHSFQPSKGSRACLPASRSFMSKKSAGSEATPSSAAKKLSHVVGLRDKITSPVSGS